MTDESDWSIVEAEEASGDRTSRVSSSDSAISSAQGSSIGVSETGEGPCVQAEGDQLPKDLSASRGNDSPPRPAVLEAALGTSPSEKSWSLASSLPPMTRPTGDQTGEPTQDLAKADVSSSAAVSEAASPGRLQGDDPHPEPEQSPESESDLFSSSEDRDDFSAPAHLPQLHTGLADQDGLDNDDSMSVGSSDTGVMVDEHACTDEEDTAERRWRRAEQRGNDIRRASTSIRPRAAGLEGYLKVIVVGESGLGKTTFIENMQAAFQPDTPGSVGLRPAVGATTNTYELFERSPEQLCTEVTISNGESKFHYFLQDTPGLIYGQTHVRIPDHITAQNARYLAWEQNPRRSTPMAVSDDHRVDACLFFLNPNHLKDSEVAAMVHLSEVVPVVPMIAKADIFTPAELSAFRANVRQHVAREEERLGRPIMWRAAESEAEEEVEGCRQPPFAVIASSHSDPAIGRFWPVRNYSWGKCEAFSSSNSDLASLKRLLFEEGFAALKQATEARYYRYRASQLSPTAEGQAGTAQQQEAEGPHAVAESVDEEGEESEEEEEDDDIHWGGDVDGAGSDASSEASDMPEIIPGDPAEAAAADAEGVGGERRGRRSPWMVAFLVAGVICTLGCMMGNIQQLKADNRGLRKELAIKEQVVTHMQAFLPPIKSDASEAQEKETVYLHLGEAEAEAVMDQVSTCTSLISHWRHDVSATPAQRHRRSKKSAAADSEDSAAPSQESNTMAAANATTNTSSDSAVQELASGLIHQQYTGSLALYTPATFGRLSSTALQSVTSASTIVGSFASTASANSLAMVKSAAGHSALSAQAAATAVAKFSQATVNKMYGISHKTGVALYCGLEHSTVHAMMHLRVGQHAVKRGSLATAAALGSFSSDVTDAARMMARDAPAVARRIQQDLGSTVVDANRAVRDAGVACGRGLSQATEQVSHAAQASLHYLQSALEDMSVPSTEWDSRAWIRFIARLGIFGAAL